MSPIGLRRPEKPDGFCSRYYRVYMMGRSSRRALYTGITSDLLRRVWEHKNDHVPSFTQKYKCHRLVYYESFTSVAAAIEREKEIKGWRREKKNRLVEMMNPGWKDLSEGWFLPMRPPGGAGGG